MRPAPGHRTRPGPGQESVWDYPRPPVVQPVAAPVAVEVDGVRVVTSARALRVLETSHPPVYYVPTQDVLPGALGPSATRSTWCEFKGRADYLDLVVGGRVVRAAGWTYPDPAPGYEALRGTVAFYPGRVDAAYVGDERVQAQEGDFYGGWITSDVVGPFKGAPGTAGW